MSIKLLPNTWLYAVSKPKKKKDTRKKGKRKKSRIQKFADQLNKNVPQSEKWFRALWDKNEVKGIKLKWNYPVGKYIADAIDLNAKVIIEVDGSIHDTVEQKFRDELKDFYYKQRGYTVIRVRAYQYDQFINCVNILSKLV